MIRRALLCQHLSVESVRGHLALHLGESAWQDVEELGRLDKTWRRLVCHRKRAPRTVLTKLPLVSSVLPGGEVNQKVNNRERRRGGLLTSR